MNTIRAFIAIELPQDILAQLGQLQAQLKAALPRGSVRWVRPEGIHLTLKFLGEVPQSQLDLIKSALAEVGRRSPPFTFGVGQAGCFPNAHRPRVVWIGVQEPGNWLNRLQRAVESAMTPLGYPPENRSFTPHLTLGRVDRNVSLGDLRKIGEGVLQARIGAVGQASAETVALIQSHLKPTGAEYAVLMRAPLAGQVSQAV